MKLHDRNLRILGHIISYCGQIEETVRRFGDAYDIFAADPIYRNAAALCILQIVSARGMKAGPGCRVISGMVHDKPVEIGCESCFRQNCRV